ncbi:PaaX family transcriptional regulator C-terminal domain-containing protein [Cellulosimicrobium sp. PMB13]|uniref:PaaX family transcriptional regulator n=1 Tax=Cellulosimicrobium sp. PMB13 TaxID=3120158 RepID=UPI003F4B8F4D
MIPTSEPDTVVLDDLDARPGSATSLLRTVVGLYLRDLGGWVAVADLVALLDAVGVPSAAARSAISRVKAKGLLVAADVGGRPGYRLAPGADAMLARGDRRIFAYRQQADDDAWLLVSFSVPEDRRAARHQLRRHLAGIGCGTVADALWICPAHLAGEVEQILDHLDLRDAATLFVTGTPQTHGTFADAAARWWDLDRIAALHRRFLARHEGASSRHVPDGARSPVPDGARSPVPDGARSPVSDGARSPVAATSPSDAFARWVRAVDDWRTVPYVDPGLPPSALPADWPGTASVALFDDLRTTLGEAAAEHARTVAGRGSPSPR